MKTALITTPHLSPPNTDVDICERCREVPWDLIADPKQDPDNPHLWLSESHKQLKSSSCRICRLFANIKLPSLDGKECPLLSQRACYIQCRSKWIIDVLQSSKLVYFGDESQGMLEVSKPGQIINIGIQRIDSKNISFKRLQQFVSYCRKNHVHVCARPTFPPASSFRVIDCKHPERRNIPAPSGCKYAALSYVWGDIVNLPSSSKYSQVVIDSIEVTLSMGLQYLWVDRHCINQNDLTDKHFQVSQMGNIYANSEITIIATAGKDATYGLPGISRSRKKQAMEVVNNVVFLEGFPHPVHSVRNSTWASRGWTYQEGFLSPRRLIFTDHGVWYLCDKTCIAEHEKVPIEKISSLPTMEIRTFTPHPNLDDNYYLIPPTRAAMDMIIEYSRRQLRYESDALDAVLGVLRFLATKGIYSIWGTLIYEGRPIINWTHMSPTKRRSDFPSWSFLGWEGPIKLKTFLGYTEFEALLVDGEYPLVGGTSMAAMAQRLTDLGNEAPRYLHLRGYVVELLLREIKWPDEQRSHQTVVNFAAEEYQQDHALSDGAYVSLKLSTEASVLVKANLDEAGSQTRPVLGLLVKWHSDEAYNSISMQVIPRSKIKNAEFLLLERRGMFYERIGYLRYRIWAEEQGERIFNTVFATPAGEILDRVKIPRGDPLWREEAKRETVVVG
ncbi:HET-domain-containing protein [Daldinia sp. FL1419]|nr:HET-domain-containing protein [Daldinia sp. FL1419]